MDNPPPCCVHIMRLQADIRGLTDERDRIQAEATEARRALMKASARVKELEARVKELGGRKK